MGQAAAARGDRSRANQINATLHERARVSGRTSTPVPLDLSNVKGKIAVDLDDTVGAWEDDFRAGLARADGLTDAEALEKYPPNQPGGLSDWFGGDAALEYAEYKRCEEAGHLYHDQPVREGAAAVLNELHERTGGRVVFLTARPESFNEVSRAWLRSRVGIDFEPSISNSRAKHEVADYEVMIDDSASHVNAITSPDAPHGPRKVIFMTQPPRDGSVAAGNPYVHRAWNWKDVRQILLSEPDHAASSDGKKESAS